MQLAGYKTVKSKSLQPATIQNCISGYDIDKINFDDIIHTFKHSDLPGYISPENLINFLEDKKINLHIPCADADSSVGKTALEKRTLREMMRVYNFLRKIDGLENLEITLTATETGVRETNRIIGKTVVKEAEYLGGYFYSDSVCYSSYPVDLHTMDGLIQKFHKEGSVAKVPYSALIPQGSDRILCAGRCVSSDTLANSGLRCEATCMAMGQVSGCAAALAAMGNISVNDVEYKRLCNQLESIGAIVPKKVLFNTDYRYNRKRLP